MIDSAFTTTAVIGGVVILCQFALLLLGFGDEADAGGDVGDAGGFGDASDIGDVGDAGDGVLGDQETHWSKADADLGHPGGHWFYEILSVRTIAAALLFFGLTGRASTASGFSQTQSLVFALCAGAASMYALFWIMKQVYKLQQSGNEDIRNAIGLDAQVYLAIPPSRHAAGKIQMRLQDRTVEYQAVSDDPDGIPTGGHCIVTEVIGPDTVCVAREDAIS